MKICHLMWNFAKNEVISFEKPYVGSVIPVPLRPISFSFS